VTCRDVKQQVEFGLYPVDSHYIMQLLPLLGLRMVYCSFAAQFLTMYLKQRCTY